MKQRDHLPFFGIGPYYVAIIAILTALGMILSARGFLPGGIIPALKTPMLVLGILAILLGAFIWGYAFFFDKIDDAIKNNRLCTDGIYAWVRNPLYVGWMFICIGASLFAGNLWLLVLPFIFWGLMALVMSLTEEKWLRDLYGAEYEAYRKRVNRTWPWFPRKRGDRIRDSYRQSRNIYDDVLTRSTWWGRLYMDIFWGGVDDNAIARKVLSYIPDDFSGRLLDVPVGTGVFTAAKYAALERTDITCLDYSADMLAQAKERFAKTGIGNCRLVQGDVGALPFDDGAFDIVLSMNGFHAFPDKEKAYSEVDRVLKSGGSLVGCFCIRGESRRTDWLMTRILSRKGWFTPPFETFGSLQARLEKGYRLDEYHKEGSIVYFKATKK